MLVVTNRLLDFSDSPAFLSTENGLLVICLPAASRQTVPIADLAAIVTSHRQVVFTQSLVAALGAAAVPLICCDQRYHPVSMLLPLDAHHVQAERFRAQAQASLPVRKKVWQVLVSAKLRAQGRVLGAFYSDDAGLSSMAKRVRSGDPENLEATGAQRYWSRAFADNSFRRGNEADPRNGMLNYGYAILRAITARALCSSGLHPALGVNHHNRYNAFCLADDMMEPLRPLVDAAVIDLCRLLPRDQWQLNRTAKATLLGTLAGRFSCSGERRTLFDLTARRAQQLAAVFTGKESAFGWETIENSNS